MKHVSTAVGALDDDTVTRGRGDAALLEHKRAAALDTHRAGHGHAGGPCLLHNSEARDTARHSTARNLYGRPIDTNEAGRTNGPRATDVHWLVDLEPLVVSARRHHD